MINPLIDFHIWLENYSHIKVVDRYLHAMSGRDKKTRLEIRHREKYIAWRDSMLVQRGSTVREYFQKFKYVVEVDPAKYTEDYGMFELPCDEALQYYYPNVPLEDSVAERWLSTAGHNDNIVVLGGETRLFVVTNNKISATMIALKYS